MARLALIATLILICYSCKVEPQPIDFGTDNCTFCTMTIVDTRYAAEFVSAKGKVSKFDAIECMIQYLEGVEKDNYGLILCTDYTIPGELIDATTAAFLISPEFPSPMGADLTAFNDNDKALLVKGKSSGKLYSWTEVRSKIVR